jgi:hypothetical protein
MKAKTKTKAAKKDADDLKSFPAKFNREIAALIKKQIAKHPDGSVS